MKNDQLIAISFVIGVLSVPLMMGISSIFIKDDKKNDDIEYKFQDTLEFVDKDTEETVEKLDNVEFRVLDKNRYMYVVKTPDLPSPEVLIMNDFPPNTYLKFYQTPVGK